MWSELLDTAGSKQQYYVLQKWISHQRAVSYVVAASRLWSGCWSLVVNCTTWAYISGKNRERVKTTKKCFRYIKFGCNTFPINNFILNYNASNNCLDYITAWWKLYSWKSFEVVHGGRKVARPIKIQIDQRKFWDGAGCCHISNIGIYFIAGNWVVSEPPPHHSGSQCLNLLSIRFPLSNRN